MTMQTYRAKAPWYAHLCGIENEVDQDVGHDVSSPITPPERETKLAFRHTTPKVLVIFFRSLCPTLQSCGANIRSRKNLTKFGKLLIGWG
jgi:hypothetical protein